MHAKAYFVYSAVSALVFAAASFSQQDLLAWTAAFSAAILAVVPVYQKVMEAVHKSESNIRDIRRKDCLEILKRQKQINAESTERIRILERESAEWQRLYESVCRDEEKNVE